MTNLFSARPDDKRKELAYLVRGKCCCIEIPGNDCWKHSRDYDAVITLLKMWKESLNPSHSRDADYLEEINEFEDLTGDDLKDYKQEMLEDIRIVAHNYIRDEYEGSEYDLPEQWAIQRIRELTNS